MFAIVIGAAVVIARRARRQEEQANSSTKAAADERPRVGWFMWYWMSSYLLIFINGGAIVGGAGQAMQLAMPDVFGEGGAKYWAIFVALLCGGLLLGGGYLMVERVSVGLVGGFTFITVVCTALLQATGYSVTFADIHEGVVFNFPTPLTPMLVLLALSTYAITGVTGNEMISYTYWCLEKGYARNTGVNVRDADWARRAQGWIRVMYVDVLLSMVVYTGTTVCFFILGAAILHAKGLNPEGTETLAVLGHIYTETLGGWAAMLFVVGSFFVLFSTTISNVAAHSRILTDVLGVSGELLTTEQVRRAANVFLDSLDLPPRCREQRYQDEADRQAYHARRNAQASKSHRKTRRKQLAQLGIDPDKIKSVPPKPRPC